MEIFKDAKKAFLLLEDGTAYSGYSVGAQEDAIGELAFNTSVVGFQEILTDPANSSNMIVETFPLVGNYGVNREDDLSEEYTARGYVIREWCAHPSNFRCQGRMDRYLEEKGITGIFGLDTRAITKKIRQQGNMLGCIGVGELTDQRREGMMERMRHYQRPTQPWKQNTQVKTYQPQTPKYHLTLVDYGVRRDILQALLARDCQVTVVPSGWTAQQVLDTKPDGVVICGGAIEFDDLTQEMAAVRELEQSGVPILGIDFGHQLMGIVAGGSVVRMHSGHRGANCPVTETATGRTFITTQNHGYVVHNVSSDRAVVSHINSNDKSCEGLQYKTFPGLSVQFIPEGELGSKNFDGIYEAFLAMAAAR